MRILLLLLLLSCGCCCAQCPYICGALIDAAATGTPSGEGKNEFIAINTGANPLAVNSIKWSYATSTTGTTYSVDGTSTPSIWTSLITPGLVSNSAGTLTHISSGTIPAGKVVVIIPDVLAESYDLATFGDDIYVLAFSSAAGTPRVTGFSVTGNFANLGTSNRWFRLQAGACFDTVNYLPANLFGGDGAGAKWRPDGSIVYANTGSSGMVLPLQLLSFSGKREENTVLLVWELATAEQQVSVDILGSENGVQFNCLRHIAADGKRIFSERIADDESNFFKLKIVSPQAEVCYSPVLHLQATHSGKLRAFPNPIENEVTFSGLTPNASYALYDCAGQAVRRFTASSYIYRCTLAELPAGAYFLRNLSDGSGIRLHKAP